MTRVDTEEISTDPLQMAPSEERLLPERRQVTEGYVQASTKSNPLVAPLVAAAGTRATGNSG
jgi:hypothetical protein